MALSSADGSNNIIFSDLLAIFWIQHENAFTMITKKLSIDPIVDPMR